MDSILTPVLIAYAIVFIFVGRLIARKWPAKYRPLFWLILAAIGIYGYTH